MGGLTNQNRYAAAPRSVTPLEINTNSGAPAFPTPTRHFPAHQSMLHEHLLSQPVLPRSPVVNSPTHSASSGSASSSSNNSCYHYNPYDTACCRVVHQQQQHPRPSMSGGAAYPSAAAHPHHYYQQEQELQYNNRNSHHHHHHQYNAIEENYPQYENVPPAKTKLPFGTLHGSLEGLVTFVPYPTEEFEHPNKTEIVAKEQQGNLSRIFLGQLPYQVTDMQLDWLCFTFGAGGAVHFPERITKHDPMRGCKVPTGCIHAYADNDLVGPMLASMHKRILVDDSGVWFADGEEEEKYLSDYCLMMKTDRTKRYQNRPYDTVVAQFATSNFVRRR